ncbi:MAG TPA: hypothetical protein VEJ47_08170 [Candidatus Eremiobacteraceae bacterium]|nr:hypothetical protein [Candidatus Eremiobacteraceae bacterium]
MAAFEVTIEGRRYAYYPEVNTDILYSMIAHRLLAIVFVGVFALNAQKPPGTHTITVTFDYNFRATPACSPTVTQRCVKQFIIYDISAGIPKRAKIGAIPVPPGATGFVKGISGTTEPLLFDPGKHRLAVSALMADGTESDLRLCTIVVQIPSPQASDEGSPAHLSNLP